MPQVKGRREVAREFMNLSDCQADVNKSETKQFLYSPNVVFLNNLWNQWTKTHSKMHENQPDFANFDPQPTGA